MTTTGSSKTLVWKAHDHFEPESGLPPQEQRRLRGYLEQIDYAAYEANKHVVGQTLGRTDLAKVQKLAAATAQARAQWVSVAMAMAEKGSLNAEQVAQLNTLRAAYEELTEAYDALRRMVERGYLNYQAGA